MGFCIDLITIKLPMPLYSRDNEHPTPYELQAYTYASGLCYRVFNIDIVLLRELLKVIRDRHSLFVSVMESDISETLLQGKCIDYPVITGEIESYRLRHRVPALSITFFADQAERRLFWFTCLYFGKLSALTMDKK